MHRIPTLLRKLHELAAQHDKNTELEIDLMLDYTRVLYADLLEWRKNLAFKIPVVNEPTLDELTEAMAKEPESEPQMDTSVTIRIEEQPVMPPAAHKRNIRLHIGINDKFLFINELFNNNTGLYDATLDQLNELTSYEEALDWLQSHFDWEDTETAQLFYNLLNSFFSEM